MTGGHQEASSSRTRDVPRGSGGISCLIRRIVPGQYKPRYVSIGPYHRNMPLRGNVEKKECLDRILRKEAQRRSGDLSSSDIKSDWMTELSGHLDKPPERYYDFNSLNENEKHMTMEEFLNMLLEDGCYILHKFVLPRDDEPAAAEGGGGRRSRAVEVDVRHDIIYLADNQIPFFILEKINEIIIGEASSETDKPLVEVFSSYIQERVLEWYGYAIGSRCNGTPKPDHLLHLLHILLIGCQNPTAQTNQAPTGIADPTESSSGNIRQDETAIEMSHVITDVSSATQTASPTESHAAHSSRRETSTGSGNTQHHETAKRPRCFLRWRRAKQYEMARVDLTGVDLLSIAEGPGGEACEARSILDVKLIRRCGNVGLEFPSLNVDSETWDMLGNLIGLEQLNKTTRTFPQRVTAYCLLMSQLACTAEDVELLAQRRVTDHLMVDDKACAESFAALCSGVVFDLDDDTSNYLRKVCVELDQRYRSRPSKWTAWMLREYFRNPCVTVATVLAVIFVAFAMLQAVYAVLKIAGKVKRSD
uniref:Uncharacterized protein n=1 Tax=Oryza glumipatula TaxID=40148 RepID=A0A0E0AUF6_9ORYZ